MSLFYESQKFPMEFPWWSRGLDSTLFTAEGKDSIPGQGTKIPQTEWPKKKFPIVLF